MTVRKEEAEVGKKVVAEGAQVCRVSCLGGQRDRR